MRRPQHRALNLVARRAGLPQHAAKKASCSVQCAGRHPRGGRFELAHEAVAAAVAEKLELKTLVGRVVGMISGELDQRHETVSPESEYAEMSRILVDAAMRVHLW